MVAGKGWRRQAVILLVLMTFLFGGCASKYGKQITNVKYYPQCYQPIQDLRNAEKQFNTTVAGSVVAGALLGAVVGAIATGKAEGAAIGAGVGALAGGMTGYALAKQRQIKDDNTRMASYLQDLDGDISGLDRVSAAAKASRNCYDDQFRKAVEMFKAKQITRAEFTERYQEIQSGSQEAGRILGDVISGAAQKAAQYQDALTSEAKIAKRDVPQPVFEAPAPEPQEEPKPVKHTRRSRHKRVKQEVAQPAPAKTAAAEPAKKKPVETGDKLTDLSTRNATFSDSLKDAKEEKTELEKAQTERQKTLDQLLG